MSPLKVPIKLETSGWSVEPWHVLVGAIVAMVVVAVTIKLETSGWSVEPWHVLVGAIVAMVVVAVILFLFLAALWRVPPVEERHFHKRAAVSVWSAPALRSYQTGVCIRGVVVVVPDRRSVWEGRA